MADYTKRGHKLHHDKDLIFQCRARAVGWTEADGFRRGDDNLLAVLQLIALCTKGELVTTLRAWLSAYGDDELLEQVEPVVEEAFAKIPEVKQASTPSTAPGKGQVN